MSLLIDLGKVSAVSVNHDWRLNATTSIRLNVHNSDHPAPGGDLLSWLKQCRPWIGRATGLHLIVQVLEAGQVLQHDGVGQSILHALCDAVANAEVCKEILHLHSCR